MIIGGLVSIITGLIMVLWPGKTLLFVAILIGVWLLIAGIIRIVQSVIRRDLPRRRRVLLGIAGLLYVIVAAVCLGDAFRSLTLLTLVIGLVWTIGGVAEVAAGFPKFWPTLLGLLSIAIGITVFLWPEPTLTLMATVIGIWLIVIGVIQLVLFLTTRLRRRKPPAIPSARTAQ
ncbi:hypothetical protein Rhe02_75920 [Rhizocola hellebori]|uniref:HdeD family acid-resistance protein n=1 Tax=Rhizocola hellebori TaxID=1392758 RepID=A0A8J3QES0_9ACTN|nr:DUF308 domain-containing protein [Rhizocola hellebori]GIH09525.1 hypothetical protein Rhe02_75920 [Rhizocola hellebori]